MLVTVIDTKYDAELDDNVLTIKIDADSFGRICFGFATFLSNRRYLSGADAEEHLDDLKVMHAIDANFPTTTLGEPHK
jgi:hypothetical protein